MSILIWYMLIGQRMLKPRGSEMQRLQCSKMRPTKFAQAVFHSHTRCVAMAPQGLAHPRGGRRPKWPQTNHSVHVMPCVGYTIYTGEKRKGKMPHSSNDHRPSSKSLGYCQGHQERFSSFRSQRGLMVQAQLVELAVHGHIPNMHVDQTPSNAFSLLRKLQKDASILLEV